MVKGKYSRIEFMMNIYVINVILYFLYELWNSVQDNFLLFFFIIIFVFFIRAILKRLRDIDITSFYVLLIFIPFLNVVFFIFLLFCPGIDDKNSNSKLTTKT